MRSGTPEIEISKGSLRFGITSPGAAICAAQRQLSRAILYAKVGRSRIGTASRSVTHLLAICFRISAFRGVRLPFKRWYGYELSGGTADSTVSTARTISARSIEKVIECTMLRGRVVAINRVGRSYNRTVGRVTLNGRNIAVQLIENGLTRPWPHYSPKPD